MSPFFRIAYMAYLDLKIRRLETEIANDASITRRRQFDVLIAEIKTRITENNAEMEGGHANFAVWTAKNAEHLLEKSRLESLREPLTGRAKHILAKVRTLKLRRYVFELCTKSIHAIPSSALEGNAGV
ncbi:hypothetical protein P167DRAFT_577850 [Morchella conica CCBAS932]|uniref:Uncharacterized protein n=1 Tax=Morchella conica CCBAS932 TaxID=1392247 RepID=A0A3N4KE43_9PEZI|nr:hypothetical protein P167DRAFT_577850 [Morchella conica CCBAS932]